MPDRIYRSMYWRIAVGFVALLAALLLIQGLLFLWLTDRFVASPSSRTPQQLADQIARDLSDALTDTPGLDVDAYVREHYSNIFQPFAVVMRDGRRASNRPGGLPPGFPDGPGGPGRRGEPDRPPEIRPTEPGNSSNPPGQPQFDRRGGRRRGRGPAEFAPIVVGGVQAGFVAVPSSPPPTFVALRELGPTLTWVGVLLLSAGAIVMALLIFRPAHKRLLTLETAARSLGEGRDDVRADETGGDEVSALAKAFNKMANDLQARAAELAASDAARRQLLADVSHELMTPLTAIRGYAQTLGMSGVTIDEATRRRYLGIVDDETHKLEALIGDLLDLARLEEGGGELVFERVPVAHLFQRVKDRHAPATTERGITLDSSVEPATLEVRADAERLEQALQNIVANAVRHTPSGGRIELRAETESAGNQDARSRGAEPRVQNTVVIAVRDTGPGIPPEHLSHVFDRFYKADASRATDGQTGSGLGLSIVRAIVRRHGGTVTASNVHEGGGAVFQIVLPG